ncbi:MAG: Crp/Fnr family transcriptional regulator [Streptosporangiaceae bacterium]
MLAVRGQGDIIGERAALTTQVRSATVTALDEVSAMVVPAERFVEFLLGHPRAAEVLERQVVERREEDKARLFRGEPASVERRLAWLLSELAKRRGGYTQGPQGGPGCAVRHHAAGPQQLERAVGRVLSRGPW